MLSVLLYSIFTAACGFAQSAVQLAVFRILLGLGMGGEWASGAALVSETWPDRHRAKALAFMQSSWAIGYMLATLVAWFVQDVAGLDWRAVFFAGVLPALLTFWIRRRVEEPRVWRESRASSARVSIRQALGGPMLPITRRARADERVHVVRLLGLQHLGPVVPAGARVERRHRPHQRDDERAHLRQPDRHLAGLRHVRIHQRRDRPEAHVRDVSSARGRASSSRTHRRRTCGCFSRSAR